MILLALILAAATPSTDDPVSVLAESDALRARGLARGDPILLVAALTLAAAADGRVFLPGGATADIGYADRRAEAMRAAANDAGLLARIAALPDVDRGAVRGAGLTRLTTGSRGWSRRIAFRGGEPAILYARSGGGQPLTLTVRVGGRTLCLERRVSGRALCRWDPVATQNAIVEVTGGANTPFDLVTN